MAPIAAIGSMFGGAGGLGSILSTVGSIVGAISSFGGKETPQVPVQPQVQIPAAEPLPAAAQTNPATLLTESQKLDTQDAQKRRRALLKQKTNAQTTTYAGNQSTSAPMVQNTTLLG